MNAALRPICDWGTRAGRGWKSFWFTPSAPDTLALIRIFAGLMLFYTHLVWAFDLMSFLGPDSWITGDIVREEFRESVAWSYLWFIDSPGLLWTVHIAGLVVFALLTLGLFTRVTSVLAYLITVAYCHRLQGSLFGLDQVNAMLAMYLMIGASGDAFSLDRWLRRRRAGGLPTPPAEKISTNIAIRLIQVHLCVIYLFGGVAKMKGMGWWNGEATWMAIANLEYQSFDMTWLVDFPIVLSLLTHITLFFETFYCCLVWPRATRPIMLALAVGLHGGIALFLGMITFGLAMLIANLAFVSPHTIRVLIGRCCRWRDRAGESAPQTT